MWSHLEKNTEEEYNEALIMRHNTVITIPDP